MTQYRRAMIWMIVLAVFWVIVEAIPGYLERGYSPFQVVWTRYAVHMVFMLAVWGWRDPLALVRTRQPVYQLARSMFMVSMPVAVILALSRRFHVDTVFSVFWVTPVLVLAAAHIYLGERATVATWLASIAAFAGAALALWQGPALSAPLVALSLLAAASFCAYVVMTRVLHHEDVRANLFYTAFGVFLVLSPLMPRVWLTPSLRDLVLLAGVGVFGFIVLYALDRAASLAPVSATAPLAPLQVAFTVGSRAALGQPPGARALVGLACIAATAAWMWTHPQQVSGGPAR